MIVKPFLKVLLLCALTVVGRAQAISGGDYIVRVTNNATAGGTAGQEMTILITNDATSAKTITFGTNFLSTGTLTASAASRHTSICFKSDGTNWYETGRAVLTN